jgi:hypothetical protein
MQFILMHLPRLMANWKSLASLRVDIFITVCSPVFLAGRCVMMSLVGLPLSIQPAGRIRILLKSFTCLRACS